MATNRELALSSMAGMRVGLAVGNDIHQGQNTESQNRRMADGPHCISDDETKN